MLITGNVMIDRRSIGEPRNVIVEDERDLAALRRWAAAAKADDTTAIVQINHPGRQSFVGVSSRVVAPSAIPIDYPGAAKPRGAHRRGDRRADRALRRDRPHRRRRRLRRRPAARRARLPHLPVPLPRGQPARRRMGRRRRATPTLPARGHARGPRRDRARPDPRDQAELLRLPARRLHRGGVPGRHRAPGRREHRPARDLRRHLRVPRDGRQRRREHPPPRGVLPRVRRACPRDHHRAAHGHRRLPHRQPA